MAAGASAKLCLIFHTPHIPIMSSVCLPAFRHGVVLLSHTHARSPRQAKAWLAWHVMAWHGMVWLGEVATRKFAEFWSFFVWQLLKSPASFGPCFGSKMFGAPSGLCKKFAWEGFQIFEKWGH